MPKWQLMGCWVNSDKDTGAGSMGSHADPIFPIISPIISPISTPATLYNLVFLLFSAFPGPDCK